MLLLLQGCREVISSYPISRWSDAHIIEDHNRGSAPIAAASQPATSPSATHFARPEVETPLIQRAISNHSNITVSINTGAREWD
jgi:hypothetical protein